MSISLTTSSQIATIVGVGLGLIAIVATIHSLNAKYDLYIKLLESNLKAARQDDYASLRYELKYALSFDPGLVGAILGQTCDEDDPVRDRLKNLLEKLLFKSTDELSYGSFFHYLFEIAVEQNKFHFEYKNSRVAALGQEIQSLLFLILEVIVDICNDTKFQNKAIEHRKKRNDILVDANVKNPTIDTSQLIIEKPSEMVYLQVSGTLAQLSGNILGFTKKANALGLFKNDLVFPSFQLYFKEGTDVLCNKGLGHDDGAVIKFSIEDNYVRFKLTEKYRSQTW